MSERVSERDSLSDEEKAAYDDIEARRFALSGAGDDIVLAICARNMVLAKRMRAKVAEHGIVVVGGKRPYISPFLEAARISETAVLLALAALQMTPASRAGK